jgi:Argininosuccinate lyase C-terminal
VAPLAITSPVERISGPAHCRTSEAVAREDRLLRPRPRRLDTLRQLERGKRLAERQAACVLDERHARRFRDERYGAGALGALTVLVRGLEFDRGRLAAAASDTLLLATDAAEALVRDGVPFRDAHEQVAASIRAGTFEPPPPLPRLGDVGAAVAAAKERWRC